MVHHHLQRGYVASQDEGMIETTTAPTKDTGTRYKPATRELAYQVWAFRTGRSFRKTAELLAAEPDTKQPSHQTIATWATSSRWHERADAELRAIAPELLRRDVQELAIARGEAVQWIRDAMAGREDVTAPKVNLVFGILSRTGVGEKDQAKVDAAPLPTLSREQMRAMTPEQLEEAMRQRMLVAASGARKG